MGNALSVDAVAARRDLREQPAFRFYQKGVEEIAANDGLLPATAVTSLVTAANHAEVMASVPTLQDPQGASAAYFHALAGGMREAANQAHYIGLVKDLPPPKKQHARS